MACNSIYAGCCRDGSSVGFFVSKNSNKGFVFNCSCMPYHWQCDMHFCKSFCCFVDWKNCSIIGNGHGLSNRNEHHFGNRTKGAFGDLYGHHWCNDNSRLRCKRDFLWTVPFDWRLAFAVLCVWRTCNCFVCFVAIFVWNIAQLTKPKLDVLSVIMVSLALVGILYAISTVFQNWWLALIVFAVGITLFILFCIRQNKIPEPIVNLKPLKILPFSIGVLICMLWMIIVYSINIVLPQYLQTSLGAKPLTASLTLFPGTVLSCIAEPVAGKIYDKHGFKGLVFTAFSIMIVSTLMLSLCVDMQYVVISLCYIPIIVSASLALGPAQSFALSKLEKKDNPDGVTILNMGSQIAACIGTSLFASSYSFVMASITDGNVFGNPNAHYAFWVVGALAILMGIIGVILSVVIFRKKQNKNLLEEQKVEENAQNQQ